MNYLSSVQIEIAPAQVGDPNSKVCVAMTLAANFERFLDRVAPIALLALGLASAGAIALVGG